MRVEEAMPSGLEQDSKTPADHLGLHSPAHRLESQFSQSTEGEGGEQVCPIQGVFMTDFKRDMVVPNSNLQLLLSDDVFLRPVRIIFSVFTSPARQL